MNVAFAEDKQVAAHGSRALPGWLLDVAGGSYETRGVVIAAGPCSVTETGKCLRVARTMRAGGATWLRGGAFKPRSSPTSFQGLGEDGLKMLAEARHETGLPIIVTELTDVRHLELVSRTRRRATDRSSCTIGRRRARTCVEGNERVVPVGDHLPPNRSASLSRL